MGTRWMTLRQPWAELAQGGLVAVGALISFGPATGCSNDCADVGARDQVILELPLSQIPRAVDAVRVCGGDRCRVFRLDEQVPVPVRDAITDGGLLRVRLILLGEGGVARQRVEREVTLDRVRPNGEGCDPAVWKGRLRFDPRQGSITRQ